MLMVSFGKRTLMRREKKAFQDHLSPTLDTLRSFFEPKFTVRKYIKTSHYIDLGAVIKKVEDQGIC
jgi:hypothetical protein